MDVQLQDTYYVVAHFHYALVAGSLFALLGGAYYWALKWTGVMYSERHGRAHFWGSMVFFNLAFFPMHLLGLAGMPRRYADYPMQFADFNALASLAAVGFYGDCLVKGAERFSRRYLFVAPDGDVRRQS